MEVEEKKRVGLVYDDRMCKHHTPDGEDHPENPLRIKAIWEKLQSAGIPKRCVIMSAKEAEDKHIRLVHTKKHIDLIRNISSKAYDSRRDKIAARFNSIYLNKGSSEAAYLAAGSVIEASERVATGELNSAVAIVRPPGHHAEADEAMGFCLYNNVAIAGSVLLNEKPELGIKKILIVDWDVHHGNGTQKMFWKDPRVLFFSVHRFDFGTFYPTGDDGSYTQVGEDLGAGYNINVPWEHGRCGDADYLAAWEHILIPVARAFEPDIVLISGGFDAAVGDPLGGCRVTPYGYSVMMKKLMEFAQGKIMMALEGGYNLDSIANSVLACVKALLDDKPIIGSSEVYPFESTWRVIQAVRGELSAFWPTLADELPAKLLLKKVSPVELISNSDSDAENDEEVSVKPICSETVAEVNAAGVVDNVIQDFSVLKVAETAHDQVVDGSILWRSVLSKIYVWYGSFGSNMWKPRLLCYIEGGKVDGMQKSCSGSMDKTPPKSVMWKTVPHRLFFGRSHSDTWGSGGVAFLHPQSSTHDIAYMCLYKITLEQFNDILLQENGQNVSTISPLFDLNALDSAVQSNFIPLESLKGGWYSNVLYLGTEGGLPILTMTCPLSDAENFRSGKHPLNAPPKNYMNTLVKGLVEGKLLSEEEAIAYINDASEMDSSDIVKDLSVQDKTLSSRRKRTPKVPPRLSRTQEAAQVNALASPKDKTPLVSHVDPSTAVVSGQKRKKVVEVGSGSKRQKQTSVENPGFVVPKDEESRWNLSAEVGNAVPLRGLGLLDALPAHIGHGILERSANFDTIDYFQSKGRSHDEVTDRMGCLIAEMSACGKVMSEIHRLELKDLRTQVGQIDVNKDKLKQEQNKVELLEKKIADLNVKHKDKLNKSLRAQHSLKLERDDLIALKVKLENENFELLERERLWSDEKQLLIDENARLKSDFEASGRVPEEVVAADVSEEEEERIIADYKDSVDFKRDVCRQAVVYLDRGMMHAVRVMFLRGCGLTVPIPELAALLGMNTLDHRLAPFHNMIPFDPEQVEAFKIKYKDLPLPLPESNNVVTALAQAREIARSLGAASLQGQ